MASFLILLSPDADTSDGPETIFADAYQQEGPMLTFFELAEGRSTIDSWSSRVASYRVHDVVSIRRTESAEATRPLLQTA